MLTANLAHPNPSGGYYSRQSGQQQTKGIAADIRGQQARGLDVVVNYAFTDAKVTRDSKPENIGQQVPGSSRHVQNTWLNYRIDGGALAGFGVSAGYQYQAKRSPWFVADAATQHLPDYFRVDGGVSYQKEKIGFNLFVNNILNKYLYSGGYYSYSGFLLLAGRTRNQPAIKCKLPVLKHSSVRHDDKEIGWQTTSLAQIHLRASDFILVYYRL